jgi:hypothetical protein
MVSMTTYLTLIDSLFSPFDVSIDQHFMQTCLNDGGDKAAVIASHGLGIQSAQSIAIKMSTSLYAF